MVTPRTRKPISLPSKRDWSWLEGNWDEVCLLVRKGPSPSWVGGLLDVLARLTDAGAEFVVVAARAQLSDAGTQWATSFRSRLFPPRRIHPPLNWIAGRRTCATGFSACPSAGSNGPSRSGVNRAST